MFHFDEKHLAILETITADQNRPPSDLLDPILGKIIKCRIVTHDELGHIVTDTSGVEFIGFIQNHIEEIAVFIEINHPF